MDTTTVQVSQELARRWKIIAAMRGITYDVLLHEIDSIYQLVVPFKCEYDFIEWLIQPAILNFLGFKEVKERRKNRSPDLALVDIEGHIKEVEVELLDRNFLSHHHDPKGIDYIIAAYGTEDSILEIPVIYFNKTLPIVPPPKQLPYVIRTYGSLSGYIYLHIPPWVCKSYNITPQTIFTVVWSEGQIVLKQEVENAPIVGISSATSN